MEDDIDIAVDKWYELFNQVINKHAPMKTKRVKTFKQAEWFNEEIKNSIQYRNMYHSKKDWINFKKWRNKTTSLIFNAKKEYYQNAITSSKNSKELWNHIKELNPKEDNIFPPKMQYENQTVYNNQDIVNTLNVHFSSVAEKLIGNNTSDMDFSMLQNFTSEKLKKTENFHLKLISIGEVCSQLKHLNINKSAGLDGIGPKFLKLSAEIISPSLTFLINKSITSNRFPQKLKLARVTAIHKGGPRDIPSNYRPISILNTISKIFERHVCTQLYEFLNNKKLLHIAQSGFRQGHSCQTALTKLIDEWLKYLDNGEIVGTVFLDFSKAFDLINHAILLEKLKFYHIGKHIIDWIKSYLSDRQQEVQYANIKSDKSFVKYGVPQGSILGPLLFLIYINDLPLHVKQSNMDLYADDSTLHFHDKNIEKINSILQNDLNAIQSWCNNNSMKINAQKTKCMKLGSKQKLKQLSELCITVNETCIENVHSFKLLGIDIDENLSWEDHVDRICKTISSKVSLLYKIKVYLPIHTRQLFYNAYILPYIDYCSSVWGNLLQKDSDRIIKLQKRVARIILECDISIPSNFMFSSLKWLSFTKRIKYQQSILMYKIVNGLTPDYLAILNIDDVQRHNLRSVSNNDLFVPRPNTNFYKKSFHYSATKVWNNLPLEIKKCPNVELFKKHSYNHFLENYMQVN